jgi:hypothetical protein
VEIDKRGTAKVSVFVGQNEIIRLTGVKKVYIDYNEQKPRARANLVIL